ncbi:MAG: DUF1460 domain-containing protein [Ignavibacteriae bacterium]|nr:DUF1460 domain-containing protein [Ignavibacteriota bacterium]
MNRRDFTKLGLITAGAVFLKTQLLFSFFQGKEIYSDETVKTFRKIISKAISEKWDELPIGELMGKIATMLLNTPYEAFTLEGPGPEICRINLKGLDCVTFFENVLDIARILKKGRFSFEELINEVTFTRYRKGVLVDYTSRLHYTSDWIYDNVKKGVVKDITQELGGVRFPINVSFMSKHPEFYEAMKNHTEYINIIQQIENDINSHTYYYIPVDSIKDIEPKLETGDIIAVATNKEGLDYSHTGMILKDKTGKTRFMHASSKKKKVVIDKEIFEYIKGVESDIGITILRPL